MPTRLHRPHSKRTTSFVSQAESDVAPARYRFSIYRHRRVVEEDFQPDATFLCIGQRLGQRALREQLGTMALLSIHHRQKVSTTGRVWVWR